MLMASFVFYILPGFVSKVFNQMGYFFYYLDMELIYDAKSHLKHQ